MQAGKWAWTVGLVGLASGCSGGETQTAVGPPPPSSSYSFSATGLGDLGRASGVESLTSDQLPVHVDGLALYPTRGDIKGQLRGTMTNNTGRILTSGELKLRFTVDFADSCPYDLQGTKKLSSLGVTDSKPWHPGATVDFTITTDNGLPAVTGDFEAATATASLIALVEDPICFRARGVVSELPASWSAAVVGSPAGGSAIFTRRTSILSAADGGSRLETVEEGVTVTVIQAKGRKLRVRTPGGTEGWVNDDYVDMIDASLLFP
jgi:hypothetical protein